MLKKVMTLALCAGILSAAALDLVKDGSPRISVESGSTAPEKKAVAEFKRIIKAVSGAEVGNTPAENRLVIGTPETNPRIAAESSFLGLDKKSGSDVFSLKTKGNVIYAAGNNPRSAMFAVFELLEQLGGHLKGHGPFLVHLGFPSLFIRVEAGDEPCYVLSQCLAGRLLPLPHLSM